MMMKAVAQWALIGACFAIAAHPAQSLEASGVVDEGASLAWRNTFALSPDGSMIAFGQCQARALSATACHVYVDKLGDNVPPAVVGRHKASWSPTWSPDGDTLAYYASDEEGAGVWIWTAADRQTRERWTPGKGEGGAVEIGPAPKWIDDGEALLFVHNAAAPKSEVDSADAPAVRVKHGYPKGHKPSWAAGGVEQATPLFKVARLSLATDDVQQFNGVPSSHIKFSNDGRRFAYLEQIETGLAVMRRSSYAVRHRLIVGDLESGSQRAIADDVLQYVGLGQVLSWSPDDRTIAFVSGDYLVNEMSVGSNLTGDLYFVPSDGSLGATKVEGGPASGFNASNTPQMRWNSDAKTLFVKHHGGVWAADVGSQRLTKLDTGEIALVDSMAVDSERPDVVFSAADNSILVFGVAGGAHDGLVYRVPVSGREPQKLYQAAVAFNNEIASPLVQPRTREIFFIQESASQVSDVWSADLAFDELRQVTNVSTADDGPSRFRTEVIRYRDANGKILQSALLYPDDYDPSRMYPVVIWVYPHGDGSYGVNQHSFAGALGYDMRLLAEEGYVIANPDIPYETGKITEGLNSAVGAAADALIVRGVADPDRIGIMGSSAGGFSTIALLSTSDRWRAGVMNAGYGDNIDVWGHIYADDPSSAAWLLPIAEMYAGGPPWEVTDAYVNNAPLYKLDKVKAPIFIQAGANDEPFRYSSNAVYIGLIRAGHTNVTSVVYTGEEHHISGGKNYEDYWRRVIAFLEVNLKTPNPR